MLIHCPECNHEVSDKAATCPNCGIQIAGNPDIKASHGSNRHKSQSEAKAVKKSNRWTIILFCFLFVIAAATVSSYYLYSQMQRHDEQEAYELAIESHNESELNRYLAHYGAAPRAHRDSVKAMLQQLRDNERDREEQEQLNAIDSTDYALACQLNTVEAYEKYMHMHPKSKHLEEVKDRIIELTKYNATTEDIEFGRDVCRKFFQAINAHNEVQLLSTVTPVMTQFLNRSNATNVDVVTFMEKFYKPDVTNLNFRIIDPFNVKRAEGDDDMMVLRTHFTVTLNIDRTDKTKERFSTYVVTADITPEGLITKFDLKKISTTE
jgi:hypothetical protein